MAFWDIFSTKSQSTKAHSNLHKKIIQQLPSADENEQVLVACIAGLLARVAWADFEIHHKEMDDMRSALKKWTSLTEAEIETAVNLAVEDIKELAGLEGHKYAEPLNQLLDKNQRYGLLEGLFQLAASDGEVEQKENEEIRVICRALLLENKHFLSARATVIEYLKSLKQ